jgi:signal peptidase I
MERWWNYLKNSSLHKSVSRRPTLPVLKEFQSELLRLFEDILNSGASLRVQVTGRSMTPYLRGGEVLTIRKWPCRSLGRGDLVLCRNRYDRPVLHRIIRTKIASDGTIGVVTKGDALRSFDEEIDGDKVLGKVCLIERTGPGGEIRFIDMHSTYRRGVNLLIATLGLYKMRLHFLLSTASKKMRR